MRVKPKEVLLNLPVALLFDELWEISSFAANINTILHGKVRLKVEELGTLGGRYVGLFYLQRNLESQQIHDEFMRLIEQEEAENKGFIPESSLDKDSYSNALDLLQDPEFREEELYAHVLCNECEEFEILHQKGEDHCRCGGIWMHNKCKALNDAYAYLAAHPMEKYK